ncbi:hypothetical protein METBIDRAFT_11528 [Metschnikowia bicuspidata var. bicuspidata NRRL YB-4993]|uniref:Uncharacterized protein n=1 Tax=Metschnikowia bicuspidata var. bicuspidata NRRL YB-4993 TaxID=869754 RepID=A0A1A0H9W7_9ASCO|nr:hypothetical protein METBIDRAFT_11528 [Metschnikowia bicuspidata var. bicuspidata NRRL YB-4993]OBA20924.1 hypothetical protein METBIDRAFT_11528 [Metschnikowia bicuspidata var. bicuspidata NRRL YB-4993]
MQRTHSLTSISSSQSAATAPLNRPRPAALMRPDLSTESLLPNSSLFARRARKHEPPGTRAPAFSFPNGEVFTPRSAPARRARPARLPAEPDTRAVQVVPPPGAQTSRPPVFPRSASMVLMPTMPVCEPALPPTQPAARPNAPPNRPSHQGPPPAVAAPAVRASGAFLTRSHSFNNFRKQSKQDLAHALRSTRLDTSTNISVRPQAAVPPLSHSVPPAQLRLFSLTNNRYAENAANIVRLELLVSVLGPGPYARMADGAACLDSAPSSLSTYNLNRSNSHTPQTSVSGSDVAENSTKLWSSAESVSSFRTARDPSPLQCIEESGAAGAGLGKTNAPTAQVCLAGSDHVHADVQLLSASGGRPPYGGSLSTSPSSFESDSPFPFQERAERKPADSSQGHSETCLRDGSPLRSGHRLHHDTGTRLTDSESSGIPSPTVSAATPPRPIESITLETESVDAQQLGGEDGSIDDLVDPNVERPRLTSKTTSLNSESTLAELPPSKDRPDTRTSSLDQELVREPKAFLGTSPGSDAVVTSAPETSLQKEECASIRSDLHNTCTEVSVELAEQRLPRKVSTASGDSDGDQRSTTHDDPCKPVPVYSSMLALDDAKTKSSKDTSNSLATESAEAGLAAKKIPQEFSNDSLRERRNSKNLPVLHFNRSSVIPQDLVAISLPILKDFIQISKLDSARPRKAEDSIECESPPEIYPGNQKISEETISNVSILQSMRGNEKSVDIYSTIHGGASIYDSEMYSPVHIDRFLADNQKAVPPRGDVAVENGEIKFQKGNSSPIILVDSHLHMKQDDSSSSGGQDSRHNLDLSAPTTNLPHEKQMSGRVARHSMLAIVDVDYEKLLPPTPEKKISKKGPLDEIQSHSSPKVREIPRKEKSPVKIPVKPTKSQDANAKGFKKLFSFMKRAPKSYNDSPPKLRWKSLMTSLRSARPSVDRKSADGYESQVSIPDSQDKHQSSKMAAQNAKSPGNKKRVFLSNLKLTTGSKVYDLLSPMYSVGEEELSPSGSPSSLPPEELKYDLPEYNIDTDSFKDVLLRFQEVEKEIENEVRVMRKSKSIHDFFLKDDELSKAQIFDLQRNDHQDSSSSLPEKSDSANGSLTSVDLFNERQSEPLSQERLSGIISEPISDFPQNNEKQTVVVDIALVQATLNDPHAIRQSYLKFVRQFTDFEQMRIELSGFDPTDKAKVSCESRQKVSSLRKTSSKALRSVKFSNSISISETHAPQLYRRSNRSVTQYYLTEYSEINRIKNELNAYKCYEMLVHEKSQANTHFFY